MTTLRPLTQKGLNKGLKATKATKKGETGKVKGVGKGKNKGKGKDKNKASVRMPAELIGCTHETSDGNAICFGFNCQAGCALAAAGQWCTRGLHVCCLPGCFGPHPKWHHDVQPQQATQG